MKRAGGGEIKRQRSLKALGQCSMFKDQEATLMLKFRLCVSSCASLVLLCKPGSTEHEAHVHQADVL